MICTGDTRPARSAAVKIKGPGPFRFGAGVGVRGADERHVQGVRHRDVVEELAPPGEQSCVLAAADRLTEGAGDAGRAYDVESCRRR